MGFTTGFTGGVTLTLGIAYLTVLTHERNRRTQAQALRSQSLVLNSLVEPEAVPLPRTRAELAREERSNLVETAKDRWNEEIENAVRWVQRMEWDEVREGMEGAISRLVGGWLQKSRESIEETLDRSKAAARKGADQAATGVDRVAVGTIAGAEKVGAEAKESANKVAATTKAKSREAVDASKESAGKVASSTKAKSKEAVDASKKQLEHAEEKTSELRNTAKAKTDRVAANAKTGAQDTVESVRSGGVVDAVRGAIRNTFSKGVEKGKEVIGMTEDQVASRSTESDIEKALRQRYEGSDAPNKTVKEALEERYKPVEEQDRTLLRGV